MEPEWQVTAVASEVHPLNPDQLDELTRRMGARAGGVSYDQQTGRLTLTWRINRSIVPAADIASKEAVNALMFALAGEFLLDELRLTHVPVADAS